MDRFSGSQRLFNSTGRYEPDMRGQVRILGSRHKHAASVPQSLQGVRRQDCVHWVKRQGVAISLDVVGPGGELIDPSVADFVGVAALGQHQVPHFAIGRVMFHIPLIWAGRGQDD